MLGIFLDTETTGLDPFVHVPLELGIAVVDLLSGKELAAYHTLLSVSDQEWAARDPKSIEINGHSWKELGSGVSRSEAATKIEMVFADLGLTNDRAVFICQNPSFDRPFFAQIVPQYRQEKLSWPYHWLDLASMYWALRVVQRQKTTPFHLVVSKDTIAKEMGLPPEERPHKAMNGVRHLKACYERLVGFPASSQ